MGCLCSKWQVCEKNGAEALNRVNLRKVNRVIAVEIVYFLLFITVNDTRFSVTCAGVVGGNGEGA